MITPTLQAITIEDMQDLRSAVMEALDKLEKICVVSHKISRHCENEHYETESVLSKEIHEFFGYLGTIEFWTLERIWEMERGELGNKPTRG